MWTPRAAREHADAIRSLGVGPVDVAGISTGGFYSRELFAETARLIPRSRLRLFEGRGHISVASHSEWAPEIARFIADSDQPA